MSTDTPEQLIDGFGRQIDYLRLSVTDRCNLRCVYCMNEDMTFLPREEVLSLEELFEVARTFVALGVRRIRLTGGEPLVRRGLVELVRQLSTLPIELSMSSNGMLLGEHARALADAGLTRLNISLDTLRPERFRALTRHGDIKVVLDGIAAARDAGFARIKLNSVILRHHNDDEVLDLVNMARALRVDISFIEEMPLGHVHTHQRDKTFVSSDEIRARINDLYPLLKSTERTGGPSVYYRMANSPTRIGFISPHSRNFCASCNRVRVTAAGRLLLCLGQENSVDLRSVLRAPDSSAAALAQTIRKAMLHKPERHDFDLADSPRIVRFMNMTGG